MTRNLIARASHTLRMTQPATISRRPRRASIRLELLETRLALSSYSAVPVPLDLNPQPLPPGIKFAPRDLNPQPLPPGIVIALNSGSAHPDLNPQPIPPGRMAAQDLNPQPLPPGVKLRRVNPDSLSHSVAPFATGTQSPPRTFSPDPTCPTCLGFI
jgi:hypothetical protein